MSDSRVSKNSEKERVPSRELRRYIIKPLNEAIVDKFFSVSFCVSDKNLATFVVTWAFSWGHP